MTKDNSVTPFSSANQAKKVNDKEIFLYRDAVITAYLLL
jgi:sulfur relay (sulfurtransferase) complex TusBCD TusD component (DsrE family)